MTGASHAMILGAISATFLVADGDGPLWVRCFVIAIIWLLLSDAYSARATADAEFKKFRQKLKSENQRIGAKIAEQTAVNDALTEQNQRLMR